MLMLILPLAYAPGEVILLSARFLQSYKHITWGKYPKAETISTANHYEITVCVTFNVC
jgi:hypothetical protein